MILLFVKVWITLILGIVSVKGEVTVANGRYSNLLVSFSQNVQAEGSQILLKELQAHLNETSKVLQNAIGLRISKVTIHVPKSWDTSEWNVTVHPSSPHQRDAKTDILVVNSSDTVYGNFPHALQYGSCGTPGRQIVVPVNFLTEEKTFPRGKALAREWLKFRYGVFDENGYPGDELYPLYYTIPGTDPDDVIVTDCSNRPIKYNFRDNENNCSAEKLSLKECSLEPSEESLENVTSSLMYFHEHIPNMQHVCGKDPNHPHSSLSPNKHNAFCRGQSVWDVLKNSTDFKNTEFLTDEIAFESDDSIEFHYVQEPNPKVVIAWENTKKLENQGETAINAIRKFVYDLPVGSSLALFPFNDGPAAEEKTYTELVNWPQDWEFQVASDFAKPVEGCVSCAIVKALNILESHKSNEEDLAGTIIIIASSTVSKNDSLIQRIKASKACLKFVVISDGASPYEYAELAGASDCGTVIEIPKASENIYVFQAMFQAMESILPETVEDRATKTAETEVLTVDTPIEVTLDSTVEQVTIWIFKNIDITRLEVQFNDKPITMDTYIRSATITALSYSPKEEGTIKFKFEYGNDELVQVKVTSKSGEYVSGEAFIHDLTEADSTEQDPVILYASVRFGAYPVQNAKVSAVIKRPGAKSIILQLNDDGAGDPDITANDGVYSRYFTNFSEKGEYKVFVVARNDGEQTTAGKLTDEGYTTCCGRSVKEGNLQMPHFAKTLQTTFSAKSGRPETGYKPSRILDLVVVSVDSDKVRLKWTAPGAEADSGTVLSYDIKYFKNEEPVQEFDKGTSLNSSTPKERGSIEEFEADIGDLEENTLYNIAIQSHNGNMSSETSNIVIVFKPAPVTTPDDGITTAGPKVSSTNKKTIGIVVGIILGVIVIVIILYLVVYFMVVKPKREKDAAKERENRSNRPSNDNHVLNPISFVSADTLIKHHNDKERAKIENKNPPVLKEEDFEAKAATSTDRSHVNNHVGRPEHSGAKKDITEPLPPKSPKRTTFV